MVLAETVVAAGLAVMIAVALIWAHLSARTTMRISRHHLEVTNVLQSYMEQVKATNYVNIATADYPDVVLSDGGTGSTADDLVGDVAVNVTDNGDDTKTIVATASWQERLMNQKQARSISLATLVSEP